MNENILIIEDEAAIADNIIFALEQEGYHCDWKALGMEGLQRFGEQAFDLVVLDVGLPDISGFEICKKIREHSRVPIIFLTARSDEIDRVVGLEIGGDDYVAKPFSPRELVARIKAILKRSNPVHDAYDSSTKTGNNPFQVLHEQAIIQYHQKTLVLTKYEYLILHAMLAQPRRVFSRDQLLSLADPGNNASMDRTIDSHIKSIRAKLRQVQPDANPIKTHRGMGYSLQTT